MNKIFSKVVIALLAVAASVIFIFWFTYDPVKDFKVSLEGLDNRPAKSNTEEAVDIGELFRFYAAEKTDLKGKWTNFRGADFDNINKENIKLIDSWKGGPKIKWSADLGEGHAAPVVYNGLVYILDYDEIKKADILRCFSLTSGKELWKRGYKIHIKRNHGMSRTIPAVNDKYIVTIGPKGHVMCLDRLNGDLIWANDLQKNYGSAVPFWYTGQCPFIENNIVVLAPAGSSLLMGVDCTTGKIVWETPNPSNWTMSHSSVVPMVFAGRKMYVYAAIGGIVGVAADGKDIGKVLWETKAFAPAVVAPSPLLLDDGKVFMTAGYGAGSILFQVSKKNSTFSVKVIQKFKPKAGMACEQQTPILYKGNVYSIQPKDAGSLRNRFICCSTNDMQKVLWYSGKSDRFGLGPFIVADGKFFILKDNGMLSIAKVDKNRFTLLDKTSILKGHDAWGPIAIADGYLLMRDSKKLVCIDIRK